jgi:acetyl esterase
MEKRYVYETILPCKYGPLDPKVDLSPDFFSGFKPENRKAILQEEEAFYHSLMADHSVNAMIVSRYEQFTASDGSEISVKIYEPKDRPEKLPVHVFYHGGGFMTCSIETHDYVPSYIAAKAEVRVVSVGYRLAPEFPFPQGLQDSYEAIEWIIKNKNILKIDPQKLSVGGDSSGGNFAAVLSLMDREKKNNYISKQVLIYPVTDLSGTIPKKAQQAYPPVGGDDKAQGVDFIDIYLRRKEDLLNPHVSPLLSEELKGLPPALFIEAGCDSLVDDGLMYAKKLQDYGVPVRCCLYPGMPHAFILRRYEETFAALDEICAFLSE